MPAMRMPSPRTGSTLMTSAPRSPRSMAPKGPARYWPRSSTTTPLSGPTTGPPPRRRRRPCASISRLGVAGPEQDLPAVLPHPGLAALDPARGRGSTAGTPTCVVGPSSGSSTVAASPLATNWGWEKTSAIGFTASAPSPASWKASNELLPGPAPVGVTEPGVVAGPQLGVAVDRLWIHGFETQDLLGRARRGQAVHGGGVDPLTVGALEEGGLMDAGRIRLRHHAAIAGGCPLVLLPDLRRVRQDALIERGLHVLPASALLPMDQRREHAGGQQETGGHARRGKVEEHGPGPPTRLLVLHAGAGLDRALPAGTVGEAVPGRIGGDRAEHQPGEALRQLGVGESQAIHGAGAERLHHHVGALAQPQEGLPAQRPPSGRSPPIAGCDSRRGMRAGARKGSPPGGSTLTTSAPSSARSRTPTGPATPQLRSSTRTPRRGPAGSISAPGRSTLSRRSMLLLPRSRDSCQHRSTSLTFTLDKATVRERFLGVCPVGGFRPRRQCCRGDGYHPASAEQGGKGANTFRSGTGCHGSVGADGVHLGLCRAGRRRVRRA